MTSLSLADVGAAASASFGHNPLETALTFCGPDCSTWNTFRTFFAVWRNGSSLLAAVVSKPVADQSWCTRRHV